MDNKKNVVIKKFLNLKIKVFCFKKKYLLFVIMNCYFLYMNYINVKIFNCIIFYFFKLFFVLKNDYIYFKKFIEICFNVFWEEN